MNSLSLYVPGYDETSRVLRRTLMRYLNVALVLVLRSISMAVKRRFPTRDHLVEAGFMTKLELEMLNSVPSTEFNTFWIPCTWFVNLLREAKQECRITDSNGLKLIMEEFNEFRSKCGMLWSYDWISIPLVYTQVVTLATYAFFGACIFGRQYVESPDNPNHNFELYIPIFTIFQLFFYMGLLKVAEQLINPFGDDDEDFELNWIIDRHMKVSYLGVDVLNTQPPPLVRDNYFYTMDMKLPYTQASVGYKKKTYRGSVAKMQIPQEKQTLLVPEFSEEDDEDKIAAAYGGRGASLWTLVGGQLNAPFSVSRADLDAVSLESGSWKVSNPSLFVPFSEGGISKQPPGSSSVGPNQLLQIPEETNPESDQMGLNSTQVLPPTRRRLSMDVTKQNIRKAVKKVVKKPQHKRKPHPQNRWVAFHSTTSGEDEVLSLFKGGDQTANSSRRESFDMRERAPSFKAFQSLPDVKKFGMERGAFLEEWEEEDGVPPETQDNLSTANLLVLYEGEDGAEAPPEFTFTRASMSPCPSSQGSNDVPVRRADGRRLSVASIFEEQDDTEADRGETTSDKK
ncbi:bestrophin-1-like isoform X2 [Uloborus diversus]|nr:bestrophin-1-like isoform X2 [Uloborus diversus]